MQKVERFAIWLVRIPAWFAATTMLLMMLFVSLDVMMKYLFGYPLPMTLEIVAAYMMPALVFLPMGLVTQTESHLEVELFTQALRPRALAWVRLVGILVGFGLFYVLLVENVEEAIKMTERGEYWDTATMQLPIWLARWFLPIGCVLTLIWLFLHGLNQIAFGLTGRYLLPGSDSLNPDALASNQVD